jgi:hypothetical protein
MECMCLTNRGRQTGQKMTLPYSDDMSQALGTVYFMICISYFHQTISTCIFLDFMS